MIARQVPETSLRLGRLEWQRLAWLLALSLAVHLTVWGGYEVGKKLHLWEMLRLPQWVRTLANKVENAVVAKPPKQPLLSEPPLMFVEVSPLAAVTEAPKNAQRYSDKNAVAANPDSNNDLETPRIDGKHETVKTDDTPNTKYNQLMPTPPEPQEEVRSKPSPDMGDLALAKPSTNPSEDQGKGDRPKPRTLVEARARLQPDKIPGQKMKQDGGVQRHKLVPSWDTKATVFGAYDAAFIEAVSQRWYDLLDERQFSDDRRGHVVLRFDLNYDGTISDVKELENTVGFNLGYICQKAVLDPAPFERWPREMRLKMGADKRNITFTFYYN